MECVAIVGVGLIGGSFGLALQAAGFKGNIIGVSSPATIEAALALGAITHAASLEEAAAKADLIYLAQPIGRILDTIRKLDQLVRPDALVTDAGSTKLAISTMAAQCLHRCQFLGGHPMAGKESRGVQVAEGTLFRGRTYALTPRIVTELETPIAREFRGWLDAIGARVTVVTPEEHDHVVAFTSHLPQLLSTALAACVNENIDEHRDIAGPGLIDSTRLALSSYDLWRDILATNQTEVTQAINTFIGKLEHLRDNLRTRELQTEFEIAAVLAAMLRNK